MENRFTIINVIILLISEPFLTYLLQLRCEREYCYNILVNPKNGDDVYSLGLFLIFAIIPLFFSVIGIIKYLLGYESNLKSDYIKKDKASKNDRSYLLLTP